MKKNDELKYQVEHGFPSLKGKKVLLTGLDDEKKIVTVVKDYGNGELLFSNGVLGRDEDCNYGNLPMEYISWVLF